MTRRHDQRLLPLEIAGLVERGKKAIERHREKKTRETDKAEDQQC